MNFFENFGKNREKEEASKKEQLNAERHNVKMNLAVKLYEKGCTDEEVEEVLAVIESAETDIQIIKNSLIGTNVFPGEEIGEDPLKAYREGLEKIKKRQREMQEELDSTIQRILSGK